MSNPLAIIQGQQVRSVYTLCGHAVIVDFGIAHTIMPKGASALFF